MSARQSLSPTWASLGFSRPATTRNRGQQATAAAFPTETAASDPMVGYSPLTRQRLHLSATEVGYERDHDPFIGGTVGHPTLSPRLEIDISAQHELPTETP